MGMLTRQKNLIQLIPKPLAELTSHAPKTIRHLFPGGGVVTPVTRSQYVISVYEAWMELHRLTVEQ
jgi:hypothetical protein